MRTIFFGLLFLPMMTMTSTTGMQTYPSAFDVATTIDRLSGIITAKGMKIFARIDFASDARAAGLDMRPEQLLIFGNPKAGTPLLQAAPSVGLDLPLKALAYEDAKGKTWVVINDPAYLIGRHALPPELEANIKGAAALVAAAASGSAPAAEKTP